MPFWEEVITELHLSDRNNFHCAPGAYRLPREAPGAERSRGGEGGKRLKGSWVGHLVQSCSLVLMYIRVWGKMSFEEMDSAAKKIRTATRGLGL